MSRRKSVLDGQWTLDPFDLPCPCGGSAALLRRGPLALIAPGHTCDHAKHQRAVARTIRIEEQAGLRVTLAEAARRLWEART